MARIARAVAPEIPHHVTQRGNRRPLGVDSLLGTMELFWGRKLKPQKHGREKKDK